MLRTLLSLHSLVWVMTLFMAPGSAVARNGRESHPKPRAHATATRNPQIQTKQTMAGPTAPPSHCSTIKGLPPGQVVEMPVRAAALAEAYQTGDVLCMAHLVLIYTFDSNCADAVKIAEVALVRFRPDPMAHLAMAVAKQCLTSIGIAEHLDALPARCNETSGTEFSSLVRGALLNDHPDGRRFAAAATLQFARFCRDDAEILLSLAQVLGRMSSLAFVCPLSLHSEASRTGDEADIPMGLTGWQILCDAKKVLRDKLAPNPAVLHAQLNLLLEETSKRDHLCLQKLEEHCLLAARGLFFSAGQLMSQKSAEQLIAVRPETGGLLLRDLIKISQLGGLRHRVLQEAAYHAFNQSPPMTYSALRSPIELKIIDDIYDLMQSDQDSSSVAQLRLQLKLVRFGGPNPDNCKKADALGRAIAEFASASRSAPFDAWRRLVKDGADQCVHGAMACPHATETLHFCGGISEKLASGANPYSKHIGFDE